MTKKPNGGDIAAIILIGVGLHVLVYALDGTLAITLSGRELEPRIASAVAACLGRILATFMIGLLLWPAWNLVFARVFPVPRLGYWHAFAIAMLGGLIWDGLPFREPMLF